MTASNFPMAEFEDGMIARVKAASAATVGDPASPLLGYVLRQVDTYKGQLNGGPERIVQAIVDVPAVWICFEDAVYGQDDGLWNATFSAVCLARNARNEQAARRGASAGEIGAYQIGKDVAGLLDGQAFGIRGVVALRCTRINAPFNMDFEKTRAAIVLLTFQAKWDPADVTGTAGDVGRYPPGQAEGDFKMFDVSWDVPPFTQPEPALPIADGSAAIDSRDTIHPQEDQ